MFKRFGTQETIAYTFYYCYLEGMVRLRTLKSILLLSVTVPFSSDALTQAVPSQPQQIPPTQAAAQNPAPPPVSVLLRKMVAFLTVEFQDGSTVSQARGTAFFVFLEDKRLGENRGFVYLVTNRHMAEPEVQGHKVSVQKVSLRMNLKSAAGGTQAHEGELPLGNGLHWFFPKDDAEDLAVIPFAPDRQKFDYEPCPVNLFATKDVIESERTGAGDIVLFTGFFYQFPGQQRIEPIVRQGILAMMPEEKLVTTLHKPGRLYLTDVHVFGGNSGAPMFVNVGGFRNGNMIVGGFPYRLLGVVSGYIFETQDLQLQITTTLSGTIAANSGISTVVPVDALKELLNSPELQKLRDSYVHGHPN